MAERPLSAEEAALWARVVAGVRPLARPHLPIALPPEPEPQPAPAAMASAPNAVRSARSRGTSASPGASASPATSAAAERSGLDGGWDRRLGRGLVAPEAMIDLHGHSLDRAYARIDGGLEQAIRQGLRLVLLVTGKPRADARGGRGAIRALVGDWLAASRHAARIAAVRTAHPRHGGEGALYLVLRRERGR